MKYIAAYALLVLGGKTAPAEDDVKKVLQEVGAEVNAEELKRTIDALKGKQLHELIAEGSKKLATLSFSGAGASSGSAQPAAKKADEKKPEEKKPVVEKEAEPDLDLGGGGLFGDDF